MIVGSQNRYNIQVELPHGIELDDVEVRLHVGTKKGGNYWIYETDEDFRKHNKERCCEFIVDTSKTGKGQLYCEPYIVIPDDLSSEGRLIKCQDSVELDYVSKSKFTTENA